MWPLHHPFTESAFTAAVALRDVRRAPDRRPDDVNSSGRIQASAGLEVMREGRSARRCWSRWQAPPESRVGMAEELAGDAARPAPAERAKQSGHTVRGPVTARAPGTRA